MRLFKHYWGLSQQIFLYIFVISATQGLLGTSLELIIFLIYTQSRPTLGAPFYLHQTRHTVTLVHDLYMGLSHSNRSRTQPQSRCYTMASETLLPLVMQERGHSGTTYGC